MKRKWNAETKSYQPVEKPKKETDIFKQITLEAKIKNNQRRGKGKVKKDV